MEGLLFKEKVKYEFYLPTLEGRKIVVVEEGYVIESFLRSSAKIKNVKSGEIITLPMKDTLRACFLEKDTSSKLNTAGKEFAFRLGIRTRAWMEKRDKLRPKVRSVKRKKRTVQDKYVKALKESEYEEKNLLPATRDTHTLPSLLAQ
jgi:hypothetical protein